MCLVWFIQGLQIAHTRQSIVGQQDLALFTPILKSGYSTYLIIAKSINFIIALSKYLVG